MSLPTNPLNRKEAYLNAIATGSTVDMPAKPITREEAYLDHIAKNGGGSGDGDMKKSVYDSDFAVANAGGIGAFVSDAISNKVDKVEGKGLSTNDYSDTEKGKVADNTSAIEAIVNECGAKNLLNLSDKTLSASGYVTRDTPLKLSAGNYELTFDFSGASDSSQIIIQDSNHSDLFSLVFNVISGTNKVYITLQAEAVFFTYYSNAVGDYSKFMIRDARITDPTYVPYAMTNRELTEKIDRGSVSVIADGVKTYSQILNELYSLIDLSKITKDSCLYSIGDWGYVNYKPDNIREGKYVFTSARVSVSTGIYIESAEITQNDSVFALYYNGNTDDRSSTVSQASYTLYY